MKLGSLAAAVAMVSACSAAYAMDTLNDAAMADTTGQAGLTITTTLGASVGGIFDYTDTNGVTGTTATSGSFTSTGTFAADLLSGFKVSGKITTTVDVGATTSSTGPADLLVDISSTNLSVTLNWVGVCANGTAGATGEAACGSTGTSSTAPSSSQYSNVFLLPAGGVVLNLSNIDIQALLGAANGSQDFLTVTLPNTFTLTLGTNSASTTTTPQFALLDPNNYSSATTAGGIGVGELSVNPSTNLVVDISACNGTSTGGGGGGSGCAAGQQGLLATIATGTTDVHLYNVVLGNVGTTSPTASIGNVALYGLNLAGTSVLVAGH